MGIFTGEFSSVWDDGVEVVNECEVDLDRMEIVEMGEERWLAGNCDGYDIGTIDDEVENLIEQYVYIEEIGLTYTAAAAGDADSDDMYGNGIVRYEIF